MVEEPPRGSYVIKYICMYVCMYVLSGKHSTPGWVLLRFEYQTLHKRRPQLISYLGTIHCSVTMKKTNVRQIHNEVIMNRRKSYIHWFRTEIHILKGIDRREDKEWSSFTTWFTLWILACSAGVFWVGQTLFVFVILL